MQGHMLQLKNMDNQSRNGSQRQLTDVSLIHLLMLILSLVVP